MKDTYTSFINGFDFFINKQTELTVREIEEMFPGENVQAFQQGVEDAKNGDEFRLTFALKSRGY